MKTILKFLVVCVILSLHSCDDGTGINHNKYVFRNECSSDMTISYVKKDNLNGEIKEEKYTFPVIPQQGELVQVMGTGDQYVRSETGEWMLCSGIDVYIELADSVINCPGEYGNYCNSILDVLGFINEDRRRNAYEYDEKADTAIYTYVFTDEKMERFVDWYKDYGVYPTKK